MCLLHYSHDQYQGVYILHVMPHVHAMHVYVLHVCATEFKVVISGNQNWLNFFCEAHLPTGMIRRTSVRNDN